MLELAILFLFQTLRSVALLFHRRIVATLALSALQNNQFTGHNSTTNFVSSGESPSDSYIIHIIPNHRHPVIRDLSQTQVIT